MKKLKMNDDLEDLLKVAETLREQEYSEIPAAIIENVIRLEENFFDERPIAKKRIEQLVDEFLTSEVD